MKVLAKPIEMVSWTDKSGEINPVRFRISNDDASETVIKIDRVITRDTEKLNGNIMYIYKCQSSMNGILKLFEVKYEISTCKWILWKM